MKAVIWLKQTFYDEYLPRMSFDHMKIATDYQLFWRKARYVDYGLDLEVLAERERGVQVKRFSRTAEDLAPNADFNQKIESVLVTKKKKKWDQVVEDFVGEGSRGYLIKNWHVYRGHASERVNKKFKKCVHYGDKLHMVPKRARDKLKKGLGPRIASLGYGPK